MSDSTTNFDGEFDATAVAVTVCSTLALYNALELELLVFTTFRAYRGLYFWSLVVASFGIIPYVVGFVIEYFRIAPVAVGISIDSLGWSLMVTGQSVVLYSRLWLVLGRGNRKILNAVKWMIIVDGLVFHITTTIVVYGKNFGPNTHTFQRAYNYIERIQMTGFTIQEFILSGLYVWKTLEILKVSQRKRSHRLMWQLFSINVIIIVLDIGLLTIEYLSYTVLEQTIKGVTYSVKLKLELAILNKLVELSQTNNRDSTLTFGDTNDFLDPTKTVWDISRFAPPFASGSDHNNLKWMNDLEKSGIQQVENAYNPNDARHRDSVTTGPAPTDSKTRVEMARTLSDPRKDKRRTGTDSELLYAHAVRNIAREPS